jgi:asparagine synthetase B (glutamine-hydrolysing)
MVPEVLDALDGSPEIAAGESCTIIFDGSLYNTDELIHAFPSANDQDSSAELLLRAYLAEGDEFLARLKGVFSLVVWDGRTGTALAVRDRMGNHPLFYARAGRDIFLSNSIDTLLGEGRVSRALNIPLLALHVVPRWLDEKDETFYEAIQRVPAGHYLRLNGDGRLLRRYWSPVPEGSEVDWVADDEAEDLFESTLAEAVRRCLDQGPAALCLSGGLDSISIAASAAELVDAEGYTTPWALSVAFPDPDNTDEARVQTTVAERLGMPQTMITLDEALEGRSLLDSALELSAAWPAPLLGIFSPAYFTLIDRAKENGREVIMTGSGGDNFLAVCLEYAADLMARFDAVGLYRLWETFSRSYRVPRPLLARRILWKYGLRNVLVSLEHQALARFAPDLLRSQARLRAERSTPDWIAPDTKLRREITERTVDVRSHPKPKPGQFYIHELRRLDHPLQEIELEEAFEKGRRLGVKVLMPYYDADVVDLLCRTHPRVLNRGAQSKSLVRGQVSRKLPGLGLENQRKITTGNFWPQKVPEAVVAWRTFGGARALGELGIVDARRLDGHVKRMLAEKREVFVPYVWEILDHEAWVRARL